MSVTMDRITVPVDAASQGPHIDGLLAQGRQFLEEGCLEAALICFTDAFAAWRSQHGTESLRNIYLGLTDCYVRVESDSDAERTERLENASDYISRAIAIQSVTSSDYADDVLGRYRALRIRIARASNLSLLRVLTD